MEPTLNQTLLLEIEYRYLINGAEIVELEKPDENATRLSAHFDGPVPLGTAVLLQFRLGPETEWQDGPLVEF